MAEKSAKKKTKKAAKAQTGVLGNLPATRPARLGADRRAATTAPSRAAAAKTAAATQPKAAATSGAAGKSGGATSAKPKTAPKKPKVRTNAGTQPKPPSAPPAGWQTPEEDGRRARPAGTELVGTAVRAAGEIAQLGLAVGGRFLKRAAGRIPRP